MSMSRSKSGRQNLVPGAEYLGLTAGGREKKVCKFCVLRSASCVLLLLPPSVSWSLPAVREGNPSFLLYRPPDIDELSPIHFADAPVNGNGFSFSHFLISHILLPQIPVSAP